MLEPGLEQILSDDDLVGCEKNTYKRLLVKTTSVRQFVCHLHITVVITLTFKNDSVWLLYCMNHERGFSPCIYFLFYINNPKC